MKKSARNYRLATLSLVLAAFGCATIASAQTAVQVELARKPEIAMQKTPEYQAQVSDSKKDPKKREWLEIEFQFEAKVPNDDKLGIVEELSFQYYVMLDGLEGPTMLSDTVNYQNIPAGEEVYSIVYVSPSSLARVVGAKDRFALSNVKGWGVEVLFKGRVVAEAAEPAGRWWEGRQPLTGLLLPKEKTPFQLLWVDRHVEYKGDR